MRAIARRTQTRIAGIRKKPVTLEPVQLDPRIETGLHTLYPGIEWERGGDLLTPASGQYGEGERTIYCPSDISSISLSIVLQRNFC